MLFETAYLGNSGFVPVGFDAWHVKVIATKDEKGAYRDFCIEPAGPIPKKEIPAQEDVDVDFLDTPLPSPKISAISTIEEIDEDFEIPPEYIWDY